MKAYSILNTGFILRLKLGLNVLNLMCSSWIHTNTQPLSQNTISTHANNNAQVASWHPAVSILHQTCDQQTENSFEY